MTPELWQRVRAIVDEAEGLDPDEISVFLSRSCGDDPEVRREVASLLELEMDLEGFITEPAFAGWLPETDEPSGDLIGQEVGPFRLVSLLGRGGMGDVYLAERSTDFEQRVALKLVQNRLVRDAVVKRFEAERQILARLDHPNIARLIDGGTTRGLPWFAMELVEGEPIDAWADHHGLGVEARLRLYLEVCSAIQLAHRNLIIHRDIKPGNILVDRDGTPKLLDFGIAKLLDPDDDAVLHMTGDGPKPMTLAYASPEQLSGEPLGTTSDIYSLGVVLYRLLAHRPPHKLDSLSPIDRMRAVCEVDPEPPSEGLSENLSAERARYLAKRLRGDLDAIVLKALRKEPEKRYTTVAQLADDLELHLRGLPVSAHRGSFAYRWGKLLKRYRWRFAAAATLLVVVVAFTLALLAQLRDTRRERDKATNISSFLIDLFEGADPDSRRGEALTAEELVDRGRANLRGEGLGTAPAARIELQRTLGVVYGKLGNYDQAHDLLTEAVAGLRSEHREDHPDLARALNDLATVDNWRGDLDAAIELYRESISMRRRLGLEHELPKPLSNFASILLARGELEEAETIYRDILERRKQEMGARHPNVASSLRSLAAVLYSRGRLDEAEPLLQEALSIRIEAYGDTSPRVASVLGSLGRVAQARGHLEEAEMLFGRTLEIRREQLGDGHLHTAIAKRDLASLLLERGDPATAQVLLDQALEGLYRVRGENDVYVAEAEAVLGVLLRHRGEIEEARTCLEGALAIIESHRGPDAFRARQVRKKLASLPSPDISSGAGSDADSGGIDTQGSEEGPGDE